MGPFVRSERKHWWAQGVFTTHSCLLQWRHIVRLGCKVADRVVVFCFGPSEETPLRREEPPTWSTKTFLTPRTHATTCQASTSATATWWSSTTTQTEYVEAPSCRVTLHCYKRWPLWFSWIIVIYSNVIKIFSFLSQAFQKMDTKKKEEQLKLLKEKYGINTDPPK